MFAQLAQVLGRAPQVLPLEVTETIEGAGIMVREGSDEEGPRVFVTLNGGAYYGAFVFDDDEAKARILKRWPELTDKQVSRAVAFLSSRVGAATRAHNRGAPKPKNWVNRYSD